MTPHPWTPLLQDDRQDFPTRARVVLGFRHTLKVAECAENWVIHGLTLFLQSLKISAPSVPQALSYSQTAEVYFLTF